MSIRRNAVRHHEKCWKKENQQKQENWFIFFAAIQFNSIHTDCVFNRMILAIVTSIEKRAKIA